MKLDVGGLTDEQFEAWLLSARRTLALSTPQSLATCLLSIDADQLLSIAERQDRVHRLLVFLNLAPSLVMDGWALVASRAQSIAGSVLAYLPAALKPKAHELTNTRHSTSPVAISSTQPDVDVIGVSAAPLVSTATARHGRALVVLLGDVNEFGTSAALLGNNGIPYAIFGSIDEVDEDSRRCVCAVVVGRSQYTSLSCSDQRSLLRSVARWNCQAWLKIGSDGLVPELSRDLIALRDSLGFTPARARSVAISDRSELTQGDLGFIQPHAYQVESCLDCSLLVDGLSEQQALLVSISVQQELTSAGLGHLVSKAISVQINRGKSGSLILICRVAGCSHPFIVRLGLRSDLLDGTYAELPKIERLILPWNPALLPSVYAIGNDAVLVYNSVRNSQNPDQPAQTLAEFLDALQAGEPPDPPQNLPRSDRLSAAIDDAFSVLLGLNKTTVRENRSSYRYVLDHYRKMAKNGKGFKLREGDGQSVIEELLDTAVSICESSGAAAVVHGDPHTKNIVLPSSSHAELIDFERAHVGHPLYDSCHLALSLSATSFRSYYSFEETISLFHNCLFGDGSSSISVAQVSGVNSVVAQGLIIAKRTAAALEEHYHLSSKEFPAMLTIVCCMALMYLPQLHAEVAKALMCAAMQELND